MSGNEVIFDTVKKHDVANDEIHDMASMYSLGLLEPELATRFEGHLDGGCTLCASELRGFNEATAALIAEMDHVDPPGRIRDELLKKIGQPSVSSTIYRAGQGEWQTSGISGLSFKQLFVDSSTGNVTSLIRMTAGTVYPPHRHFGLEHCYVLEGDLAFRDHTLHAGDYEVASPDTDHSPVTTQYGCLLLIMNNQGDQLLA